MSEVLGIVGYVSSHKELLKSYKLLKGDELLSQKQKTLTSNSIFQGVGLPDVHKLLLNSAFVYIGHNMYIHIICPKQTKVRHTCVLLHSTVSIYSHSCAKLSFHASRSCINVSISYFPDSLEGKVFDM